MTHKHYISNGRWQTLAIGVLFWIGLTAVVLKWQPNWRMEILANGLLLGGLIFVASWMWGTRKYGLITAIGLWGLLVMKRLGVLDWIGFGAWMVIIGLITLIN